MPKKIQKLTLNQETLRNLSAEELRKIEGGAQTGKPLCQTGYTCPECAPPVHKQRK